MNPWRAMLVAPIAALVVPALAADKDKKPVDVEVWTIRATTKNKEISPELRSLAEALKKQFKYTGFKLEKKSSGQVDLGKSHAADLIAGYRATITPKERKEKKIKLQVAVSKKGKAILSSTVTIPAGPFQLFGGWQLDGGDALIIAVRAR